MSTPEETIKKAGELIEFANAEIERLETERDRLRAALETAKTDLSDTTAQLTESDALVVKLRAELAAAKELVRREAMEEAEKRIREPLNSLVISFSENTHMKGQICGLQTALNIVRALAEGEGK